MTALLEVRDVIKRFGGVRAVDGVTLTVDQGAIHGLIGPNGSGKTTLLGVIAGTHRADAGVVSLEGVPVSRRHAHLAVRAGVARTFQTTRLFMKWTLRDNLKVAAEEQRAGTRISVETAAQAVGLEDKLDVVCSRLTNAEQRLSMIAVGVATRPKLVLLDEPAVGMSGGEVDWLAAVVRHLRDDLAITVIVVEHNMHFLMRLVDQVTVMATGKVLADGTPADIRANADVIASYLGS